MSQIRRRKKYFIKPGFQSRLTAIFILIVIIVANIVGALVYGFSVEKLESNLVEEAKLPVDSKQLGQALLPGVIIAELISIFVVAFICIFVTHTIAGPVYRMEKVVRNIGEGDLTHFIKLRPKDELKDLADAMNEMTMGLRNKIISFKENVASIRDGVTLAKSTGNVSKLEDILKNLETMEESLHSFTLEKERREQKPDSEENTETAEA
ncbi:MAG TPA: methyl-accepting chemotaxis protein [Candidatus Rifleibacterium sp.]|nr:methyl-accepting chemotaxis protein [Candidatus Rifleibacterium sp.]HNW12115.1 methyl-accepting chemotaxis protein [Candidatus Rifleibacterium sp.]HOI92934.1 methyl-accepting chemotaxis protein [Candidatus Rifleibacterium sp.]HPW58308.1 methyl-accepting chemotaxis protein [Candidatus Rifleibacterium sp.]